MALISKEVAIRSYLALLVCVFLCGNVITHIERRSYLDDVFACPVCIPESCPLIKQRDCMLVREPGICGCCLECAVEKGNLCGISRGRCAPGLRCKPRFNDPTPLHSLLLGRGICLYM